MVYHKKLQILSRVFLRFLYNVSNDQHPVVRLKRSLQHLCLHFRLAIGPDQVFLMFYHLVEHLIHHADPQFRLPVVDGDLFGFCFICLFFSFLFHFFIIDPFTNFSFAEPTITSFSSFNDPMMIPPFY